MNRNVKRCAITFRGWRLREINLTEQVDNLFFRHIYFNSEIFKRGAHTTARARIIHRRNGQTDGEEESVS